jgi:hypothetical protein
MAARARDVWLGDFSLVLSKDHLRSLRRDPQYEVFSGSKPLSFLWLIVAGAAGGALGGTLVSGALWGPWWQVPAWIAALVATAIAVVRPTLALSGQPLGFMAGWSLFWGLLIGAVTMGGAQLDGAVWAYGIAGGIGFFVGITQGIYEPDAENARSAAIVRLGEIPAQSLRGMRAKAAAMQLRPIQDDYESHGFIAESLAEDVMQLSEFVQA